MSASIPDVPSKGDVDAAWPYIEAGLRYFMAHPNADAKTHVQRYIGLSTAVWNYCTSTAHRGREKCWHAGELYQKLDDFIKELLAALKESISSMNESHTAAFEDFQNVARRHERILMHLDTNYVARERDEGKDVPFIYALHMIRWKECMGERVAENHGAE